MLVADMIPYTYLHWQWQNFGRKSSRRAIKPVSFTPG